MQTNTQKVNAIIDATAEHFFVSAEQIRSRSRKRNIVIPRHVAMLTVADHLPKLSLESIGHFFNRDHATVMSAKENARYWIATDKDVQNAYEKLRQKTVRLLGGYYVVANYEPPILLESPKHWENLL